MERSEDWVPGIGWRNGMASGTWGGVSCMTAVTRENDRIAADFTHFWRSRWVGGGIAPAEEPPDESHPPRRVRWCGWSGPRPANREKTFNLRATSERERLTVTGESGRYRGRQSRAVHGLRPLTLSMVLDRTGEDAELRNDCLFWENVIKTIKWVRRVYVVIPTARPPAGERFPRSGTLRHEDVPETDGAGLVAKVPEASRIARSPKRCPSCPSFALHFQTSTEALNFRYAICVTNNGARVNYENAQMRSGTPCPDDIIVCLVLNVTNSFYL